MRSDLREPRIHISYNSKFDYGVARKKRWLRDFKERNGFGRVDTPRYYVPLTALGGLPFAWDFHHRMADRIPESVATGFRRFAHSGISRKYRLVEAL